MEQSKKKLHIYRLAGIIAVLCIGFFLTAYEASAGPTDVYSGVCGDNAVWTLDKNGLLTISGTGALYDCGTDINAKPRPWFEWEQAGRRVKEIIIEDGITDLGRGSIVYFHNYLKKATIGDTVHSIGTAFSPYGPESALEEIYLPDSLTHIEKRAFYGCPNLKTIEFGNNMQSIGAYAFEGCSSLAELRLPDSLTEISYAAFYNCTGLTDVTFGNGLKTIGDLAFNGCDALKTVTLPASVEFVDSHAFSDNTESLALNEKLKPYGRTGYAYLEELKISGKLNYKKAYQALKLVNKERSKRGIAPLKMDEKLLEAAMHRSTEITVCFSHVRPDGSSCDSAAPYDHMHGENIASGSSTAKGVINRWMNSEGHRASILSKAYNSIGIGCFIHEGGTYWVQCFGRNEPVSIPQSANKSVKAPLYIATSGFDEGWEGVDNGDAHDHEFKFSIVLDSNQIKAGKTKKAKIAVENIGLDGQGYAIVTPVSAEWKSKNEDVATVSSSGKIKGISNGKSKITAKMEYYKASKTVTVKATVVKIGKAKYSIAGKTAAYKAPTSKKLKSVTIPNKIKYKGKTYRVTTINANAFKNNKNLKRITIKATKLDSIGKNAFKGIHKMAVIKTSKKYKEKYKELIEKSGIASSVKIK